MAGRRLLLFVVLLLLVGSIASAITPRQENMAVRPTQPASPPPAPVADVVRASLPSERDVRARVGDVVEVTVEHTSRDVVQIVALGLSEPVERGLPARLVFDADREGRFGVTLRYAGRRIGTVDVRPER